MRRVPLRELVLPVANWQPTRDARGKMICYIDIASIDRDSKTASATEMLAADAPSRARQIVQAGDVLVSTVRPNLNAVAVVPEELDGATASTGFAVIRADPNRVDPRLVFYWVRSPVFIADMMSQATGASYPAVSDCIVFNSTIPLHPLPEQRRIAALLDEADALCRKRRESLKLLDDLLRSTFLDLFGDPVTNPKGWKTVRLDEVADIASGVTKGRQFGNKPTVVVPYMRVANVQDGYLRLDEIKEIEVLPADLESCRLLDGDVLLTEGGDPDKLGRGAVWRDQINPCIHQNHVFRVRCRRDQLLPDFASAILGSELGKRYFLRSAKQTTGIASINKTQLSGAPVLMPPLRHQVRFADAVATIRTEESRLATACTATERLFSSLLSSCFAEPGQEVGKRRLRTDAVDRTPEVYL